MCCKDSFFQSSDETELMNALEIALDAGYRHIDTAWLYENEAVIGKVLKKWLTSGKLKREDLFITTKLPICGVHEDRVELFIKKSLENLQLDYVDLYLIHFPVGTNYVGTSLTANDQVIVEKSDHVAIWKVGDKLEIFQLFRKIIMYATGRRHDYQLRITFDFYFTEFKTINFI